MITSIDAMKSIIDKNLLLHTMKKYHLQKIDRFDAENLYSGWSMMQYNYRISVIDSQPMEMQQRIAHLVFHNQHELRCDRYEGDELCIEIEYDGSRYCEIRGVRK